MKEEIKEDITDIMELLETTSKKEFYRLTIDHELVVRLYNYITNLQKENKELKEEIQRQSKALRTNDKLLEIYRDRTVKAIDVINTQMKNLSKDEAGNLRIIKFNLIKGSCTPLDLTTEEDYKY